jgi:G3E family GTPase
VLNRPNPPEILIVETSGVSDPKEVILTFDDPTLQALMTIECLISVVDAELFPGLLDGEMRDLAMGQVHAADVVVLNKIDLVDNKRRLAVRALIADISPASRLVETTQGKIPLALALGASGHFPTGRQMSSAHDHAPEGAHHHHHLGHPFSTWHWRSEKPLSFPKLRKVIEGLPETVYRAKGVIQLEELPRYKTAFQMVGKRYNFRDTDAWGEEPALSEIVLIASKDGFDPDLLQTQFEACIGTGDESQSPILQLARKLKIAHTYGDTTQQFASRLLKNRI